MYYKKLIKYDIQLESLKRMKKYCKFDHWFLNNILLTKKLSHM